MSKFRAGAILSGADQLRIEIHGVGSHAAQPHRGLDPIVIACDLVGLLQTIVSRSLDPLEAGVVTVGTIHGGTASNIIPDLVVLEGTMRSMSDEGRALLQRRVREICEGSARAFGARIDCMIEQGCPPTINHQAQAAAVAAAARRIVSAFSRRCTHPSSIRSSPPNAWRQSITSAAAAPASISSARMEPGRLRHVRTGGVAACRTLRARRGMAEYLERAMAGAPEPFDYDRQTFFRTLKPFRACRDRCRHRDRLCSQPPIRRPEGILRFGMRISC